MTSPKTVPELLQLKIELEGITPAIWRRILVPASITLPRLHRVIQRAMGWRDYHLHEFRLAGERYGIPDPHFDWGKPPRSEQRVRLGATLGRASSFQYTYDFGDNWCHRIIVEERLPYDPSEVTTPRCTGGANACPPDDVGGIDGYEAFIAVMANPGHPDHQDMTEWHDGPFARQHFDLGKVNRMLSKIKV